MPDLNLQITGVKPFVRGLTPLLCFNLKVSVSPETQAIQGLLLNAQIQIQAPQRTYTSREKERLYELFGPPASWGQTLRNRLWAHANVTVGAFHGHTETVLSVPCTFDLNLAASKFFYALEEGEVPLLFLFSGSLFYCSSEGRLQVGQVPWSQESIYRMPVQQWHQLMDEHYPNCAWLYLRRDIFDRLNAFKRRNGLADWDETLNRLLTKESPVESDLNRIHRDREGCEVRL